ncbi:MAG: hypothetical protein E2O36_07850 [Proteobacteria bacterium]|nr:MAG: hypothetical protein E2O36_07850 [Pseudomonadota bacterium]
MTNSDVTKTLWSKTLYEGLFLALDKDNTRAVMAAIVDLKSKGYLMPDVLRQVREDKGGEAEKKLNLMLLKAKNPSDGDKGGFFALIKNFFR